MDYEIIIAGLGLVGMSSFRAFVPAFAAACIMRFGSELGLEAGMMQHFSAEDAPTWFTSNGAIGCLGLLAALEIGATKNADARAMYGLVEQYAKPTMAGVTQLGILSAADARFLQEATPVATLVPVAAGMTWHAVLIPLTIAGTWGLSFARGAVMSIVSDADEDDDTGIQGLWSWAEDIWAFFGLWLLVIFPVFMLIVIGIVAGVILLLRRRAAIKDEQSKIDCVSDTCQTRVYASAMACQTCAAPVACPCRLNIFGGAALGKPADLEQHPYDLTAQKRCPVCATRLEKHHAQQTCTACGHELFKDEAFLKTYTDRVAVRLPLTLAVSALFSLVPIVGLIPGIIYYRVKLVAPFRRYVPRGKSLLMKWAIRILFFVLIAVQWMPGLGVITVPVMALVSFLAYRGLFMSVATAERDEA